MLPDQLDPLLGEVGAHEVARADPDVAVAELRVRRSTTSGDPLELRLVLLQPAAQEPATGGWSGKNGTKWKRRRRAASSSAIERSAVFIVPMTRGSPERELVARVLEPDALVAVLEQEVELAEDLRDVAAVDLVDDQDEQLVGRLRRRFGDLP